MASLKDVARAAEVSIATVSHVLRGTKRVTPEVAGRVRAAAERLGYVPNRQARGLRTGRSHTFGVVLPDLGNPFFPALFHAIEVAARAQDYAVLVSDSENDPVLERGALRLMGALQVDGVVWAPVGDDAVAPALPTVTVDRPVVGCDTVHADHRAGGVAVGRHLLGVGLRRIGLLSGPAGLPSARERREGLLSVLPAGGEPCWELAVPFSHELPLEVQARLAAPDVDVVVCANDAVAVGAARALARAGVRVPQDVSLVGFDDIPWAALMDPPLTTVRQPLAAIGAEAVRLLRERLAHPDLPVQQAVLPVELVARGSTLSAAPLGGHGAGPGRAA